ncbi:MAG: HAMP domain-containing protein [Candidatus Staskawiczbacteria bacterium]|jgi:methyl-accepting chemotaxis protein
MSKLTSKIAVPIILAGIFSISIFMAIEYNNLDLSFYIILILLTLFVFFFGFATGQNLSSPVKKILENADELSKGSLSSRVYLETKDELAELAKAFNGIAEKLQESHAQEENTEKTVDIKVKAKTQALEETIDALEQKIRNRTAELQNMIKSLEKFQGESTIKELEITNLRNQIKSLEENTGGKQKKKSKTSEEAKKTEDNIESD